MQRQNKKLKLKRIAVVYQFRCTYIDYRFTAQNAAQYTTRAVETPFPDRVGLLCHIAHKLPKKNK
jgi:hypothetical protein